MFYLDSLEVYRFIVVYTTKHLYPPSIQEIAKEFRTSKSIAFERCKDLDLHGYVNITKGISRGITLIGYELVNTTNGRAKKRKTNILPHQTGRQSENSYMVEKTMCKLQRS